MTFGCTLPNRGRLATPERIRSLAVLAEDLGFDSIWVRDHIVVPTRTASSYPYSDTGVASFVGELPYCEALATLAYLAASTQRVRLGTHVLVLPYRHPVLTAKMVATIDYLSGGRLILGVGAGWLEEEFTAVGQPHFRERGAVTDECIRLFKELWTRDEPSFHGRYYQVSDVKFYPKPVQKPHPPIWVGGHSHPAMRRAATLGDGWMPIGLRGPVGLRPEELEERIAQLRDMATRAGRDPDAVEVCFCTNLAFTDGGPAGSGPLFNGSAQKVAADIRCYQHIGVKHFVFSFGSESVEQLVESMERFAREVRPLVLDG